MFQYATGRALSLEQGVSFKLDISDFAKYELHQGFELDRVFNGHFEIATKNEIHDVLDWQGYPTIRKILARPSLSILHNKKYVLEPHFHYWENINLIVGDCYLSGYWQSEKYFKKRASTIRSDFSFEQKLEGRNAEIAWKISKVNAVSLHVRRGDYVTDLKNKKVLNLCLHDYYYAAISHLLSRIEAPYVFIFSDDIDWVKRNLNISVPCEYVGHNREKDSFIDMHLMSLCRHHVIANSSFSWWGAWLGINPDKIVIAPTKWFSTDKLNSRDLVVDNWVTL